MKNIINSEQKILNNEHNLLKKIFFCLKNCKQYLKIPERLERTMKSDGFVKIDMTYEGKHYKWNEEDLRKEKFCKRICLSLLFSIIIVVGIIILFV